jgi:hypothetical protein
VAFQGYTYDAPLLSGGSLANDYVRGPPFAVVGWHPHRAGDHGLIGLSARPLGSASLANNDDNAWSRFARTDEGSVYATRELHGRAGERVASPSLFHSGRVAAKSADEFVNLASASRRSHILDGEVRPNGSFGGGHRPGAGFPGKSEFPSGWSDDRIMHAIWDIATDPSLTWRAGNRPGDFFVNGTRDGIDIEVLIRNTEIWTGYPTNVARNP